MPLQVGSVIDRRVAKKVANRLQSNQPTPTDIDFSLERFNLIKRAYWVNGQREKARSTGIQGLVSAKGGCYEIKVA